MYKGIFNKKASDKNVLMVSRITVVVVAVIAYVIALNPDSSVMTLVSDAWAGFGAAFGPVVLLSLYWNRTNLSGAIAGIVSGAATVIIWDYIPCMKTAEGLVTLAKGTGLYSLAVGFFISLILIILFSLLSKAPSDEILQEFEKMKTTDI